jgi:hypothetical protein
MKRLAAVVVAAAAMIGVTAIAQDAWAGSPHFVSNTVQATIDGNTVTVSGKEAGLGDEDQVHIVVTADAECINPGNKKPQAANKESFSTAGDFPVQNGKAEFSLTVTATFQPDCTPPMTLVWSNITVTDTTNGISRSL